MKRVVMAVMLVMVAACPALAEVKSFDVAVEEAVGKNQSQDAVEAFALQKAKRLAVEKAGTFLSSLAVVREGKLSKQEITALASGVVRSDVLESVAFTQKGQIRVRVKARVAVDTSVLDDQIQAMLHDKELLKKLEAERARAKELEEQLKDVKGAEVARLEELNRQAVALEMDREKQRLFREEQRLKALGALAEADKQRLREERERMERFQKVSREQEAARQREAEAIARERDRVRKAQLENERRANELARKAEMNKAQWVAIDDRLSLQQAVDEADKLTREIANLRQNIKTQYEAAKKNLEDAYDKQMAASKAHLPPPPAPRDPFETTKEYDQRIAKYNHKIILDKKNNEKTLAELRVTRRINLYKLKVDSLKNENMLLSQFVFRLEELQTQIFVDPNTKCNVTLDEPDPDASCFPLILTCQEPVDKKVENDSFWTRLKTLTASLYSKAKQKKAWRTTWRYSDRETARAFWETRSFLIGQGLYQVGEGAHGAEIRLTGARVSHPGTSESRDFIQDAPPVLAARNHLAELRTKQLPEAELGLKLAYFHKDGKEPITGMEFIWIPGGCYQMGNTFRGGYRTERPVHKVCLKGFWMGRYEVTQAQWKQIMGSNPSYGKKGGDYPVEWVSRTNAQDFIARLNEMTLNLCGFSLPTEAQWEYACRSGGKNEKYAGGNKPVPRPKVGFGPANGLGLYGMNNNIREMVMDRWHNNYKGAPTDGSAWIRNSEDEYVVRGGSLHHHEKGKRCAYRSHDDGRCCSNIGFRIIMTK